MKKRISALFLAIALLAALSGCGGKEEEKKAEPIPSPHVGTYISMAGEMWGVVLTGEDIEGWSITLEEDGKGRMEVDGEKVDITYTLSGEDLTLTVEEESLPTKLQNNDTILVEDFMGLGMKLTFGKEGTPAADPANYQSTGSLEELFGETEAEAPADGSGYYQLVELSTAGTVIDGEALTAAGLDAAYLLLNPDGTGEWSMMDSTTEILWDEEQITYGAPFDYERDGDRISVEMNGQLFVFELS